MTSAEFEQALRDYHRVKDLSEDEIWEMLETSQEEVFGRLVTTRLPLQPETRYAIQREYLSDADGKYDFLGRFKTFAATPEQALYRLLFLVKPATIRVEDIVGYMPAFQFFSADHEFYVAVIFSHGDLMLRFGVRTDQAPEPVGLLNLEEPSIEPLTETGELFVDAVLHAVTHRQLVYSGNDLYV